jgi:DNA-directed RNA polymerase subunit RPC12/RpoP
MNNYTYADLCEKCGAEIELIPNKWIVCKCGNKYKLRTNLTAWQYLPITIKLEIIDPAEAIHDQEEER